MMAQFSFTLDEFRRRAEGRLLTTAPLAACRSDDDLTRARGVAVEPLTGAPRAIRDLALRSYFVQLGDTTGNATGTMVHTETIVLVDGAGHIRGMYDGSLAFDTQRLIDDIRSLHPGQIGRAHV